MIVICNDAINRAIKYLEENHSVKEKVYLHIAEGFDCDLIVVDDNNRIDTVIINGEIFGGEKDEFDFM